MSLSKYGSTVETTNLARLARIILGPCTGVLQDVLKKNINPSVLPGKVKTFITHLPKLKKSPFTKQQETIVYTGIYSDFDITLLYILFRNICTFPPHLQQWGNVPNPGDRSESANIERIRLLRNKYQGHFSSISISSSDFNQEWQAIFDIIKELEMYLGTCTVYQEEVKKITQCCMDPEQETKYIEQLLDLNKKIDDISVKVEIACVCKKRKESFDREVYRWKEDDIVFLETHNFPAMFKKVVNQPYVTFVGVPGSGKSATTRHIALKLQKQRYDILPIKDISDIETLCNPEIPQVFVIDDVVGVFGLDLSEFNKLCKYESIIKEPEGEKTKILMTCREVVYRNAYLTNTFLSENENVVFLHSDENSLTEQDKYNLLAMYNLDKKFLSPIDLSSTSKMFPFLCKLYSNTRELRKFGPIFFKSPYPLILGEMDKLKIRNKIQYASLVLLMVNDGSLSETILDDHFSNNKTRFFQEKKLNILKRCKVESQTNSFSFIDALSDMEGTYTKKSDNEFTFIHDSLFEIIACHFGRQFPELMIQYMSSNYIAHYIKVDRNEQENRKRENEEFTDCKANSLCIILSESHYQMLAERLFRDVENGVMFVFGNEALKHPSVVQTFIKVMSRKSYTDLYSTFLSVMKEDIEYLNSFLESQMKKTNVEVWDFLQIWDLILSTRCGRKSVRAISWVIYYGHHQILQYIIDQILSENGNVNDLFQNPCNNDDKESVNVESNTEKVFIEQFRLLCLGCYSADQTTVKTLLKHIDIKNIINTVAYTQIMSCKVQPLVIVCKLGYVSIAKELLQAGASVNRFDDSNTPIVVACANGHSSVVKELIKAGADINFIYGKQTALTAACSKGHLNVVKQLICAGVDVNFGDRNKTPLTAACKPAHLTVVEELIKSGADINLKGGDKTPLFIACSQVHLSLVRMIIKAGADVNLGDGTYTPLTAACINVNLNVVEELIKAGADVNLKDKEKTPLIIACVYGHFSLVQMIINAGADVNLGCGTFTPLEVALDVVKKTRADVDFRSGEKFPLKQTCCFGHSHIENYLENARVNVNSDDDYNTPQTTACITEHELLDERFYNDGADHNFEDKTSPTCSECYISIAKELIKAGADVNLKGNGKTLISACVYGQLSLVQMIIKAGADVNLGYGNDTPLTAACSNVNLKVVKELIQAGADVNLDDGTYTPLTAACSNVNLKVVEELIQAGADVNLGCGTYTPLTAVIKQLIYAGSDDGTYTPFSVACSNVHLNLFEELKIKDDDVNLKGEYKTPLIIACVYGHLSLVQLITKAGADVNLGCGIYTPLTAACRHGYLNIVKELIYARADVNLEYGTYTPLTAAHGNGHLNVVRTLLKAGANFNCKNRRETTCNEEDLNVVNPSIDDWLGVTFEHNHLFKSQMRAGNEMNFGLYDETPLATVCKEELLSVVEALINAGADVNLGDKNGQYTPLIVACVVGHLEVVNVLINAGADVNLRSNGRDCTPLIAACKNNHLGLVDALITAGADVNLTGRQNTSLKAPRQGWLELESVGELDLAGIVGE